MRFEKAGAVVEGHKHNFDHTTYVVRGGLLFEKLDEDGNVIDRIEKRARSGFNWITIEAGVRHRITALPPEHIFTDLMLQTVTVALKAAGMSVPDSKVLELAINTAQAMDDRSIGHCIYAHRTPQGDVVQEYDGWTPGYV